MECFQMLLQNVQCSNCSSSRLRLQVMLKARHRLPGGWQMSASVFAAILFGRLRQKKLTEPRGEENLSECLFSQTCVSQLLACCCSTLFSPSYVQLASLLFFMSPNPAPVGNYSSADHIQSFHKNTIYEKSEVKISGIYSLKKTLWMCKFFIPKHQ